MVLKAVQVGQLFNMEREAIPQHAPWVVQTWFEKVYNGIIKWANQREQYLKM